MHTQNISSILLPTLVLRLLIDDPTWVNPNEKLFLVRQTDGTTFLTCAAFTMVGNDNGMPPYIEVHGKDMRKGQLLADTIAEKLLVPRPTVKMNKEERPVVYL